MSTRGRDRNDREGAFLDRWSRMKRARAEEEKAAPAPAAAAPAPAPDAPAEDAGLTDEELLEKLGLPDPDSLKAGDDFAAFMARAVPERLRSRALRRLWLTNPVLANLDQLVDYGEDYTDAATVVENLQTAYRVGKGLLRDPEPAAPPDAAAAPEGAAQEPAGEAAESPARDAGKAAADAPPDTAPTGGESDPRLAAGEPDPARNATDRGEIRPATPRRARMRFHQAD